MHKFLTGGVSELSVGITLNNIFNQSYQVVQGYPMPGTNLLLILEYNW